MPASTHSTKILAILFLLTLPLVNPWVRGDGVGYYAYVRSLLLEHKLAFENDWRAANESFIMDRVRPDGTIDPRQYTRTGHLDNHFAVGASMLWAPFIVPVHYAMVTLQAFGMNVKANGFSRPYIIAMALATALYGFLGLLISFHLGCLYTEERWALLATLGIWFASSLPVYMYFNPSWSHAHSVFVVAVFLWYWHRTRQGRSLGQWVILGLISGLVLDVYYANIALLLVPLLESLRGYWRAWREAGHDVPALGRLFAGNLVYCLATMVAFSPTLITRQIIYGHPFAFGYGDIDPLRWASPHLGRVLFSSDHGLLVWTPVLIPAVAGLFLFYRRDRELAAYFMTALLAFYYLIAIDSCWDGISSFGNRFFISLTPLFVLGLAAFFSEFAKWARGGRAFAIAGPVSGLFILWNLGFIFQWGTHLVPARGPISWKQMVHNQFAEVPKQMLIDLKAYTLRRGAFMQEIEQEDVQQLKQHQEAPKAP
ncbi:MAG TPA: hypothetical protein VKO18_01940 [Terriglobia bacterium]|nr:hypothetical protein [Terriglobia bacterium]